MFLATEEPFPIDGPNNPTFRLTADDYYNIADWQLEITKRWPAGSKYVVCGMARPGATAGCLGRHGTKCASRAY